MVFLCGLYIELLGDPDDRHLRVVEKDVVIPKRMKERANKEKCADLVKGKI